MADDMEGKQSLFHYGDRVQVCDSNAPWSGNSGVITRRGGGVQSGPYSVWMVKLDGLNQEVAHYEKELRHEAQRV